MPGYLGLAKQKPAGLPQSLSLPHPGGGAPLTAIVADSVRRTVYAGSRSGELYRVSGDRLARLNPKGARPRRIRRVIQRNIGQIRFCYEQGLHSRPDLSGRVGVRFIISPSGGVQTAMVASTTLGARKGMSPWRLITTS